MKIKFNLVCLIFLMASAHLVEAVLGNEPTVSTFEIKDQMDENLVRERLESISVNDEENSKSNIDSPNDTSASSQNDAGKDKKEETEETVKVNKNSKSNIDSPNDTNASFQYDAVKDKKQEVQKLIDEKEMILLLFKIANI